MRARSGEQNCCAGCKEAARTHARRRSSVSAAKVAASLREFAEGGTSGLDACAGLCTRRRRPVPWH
eukprot:scaffold109408_cov72-Phaeocystis_antarctica.AAC.1